MTGHLAVATLTGLKDNDTHGSVQRSDSVRRTVGSCPRCLFCAASIQQDKALLTRCEKLSTVALNVAKEVTKELVVKKIECEIRLL